MQKSTIEKANGAAYQKQYYLNNKDKIAARCKQYYLNNKDKRAVKHKQYNLNNKEYRKRYYLNNKDKRAVYDKQKYLDNKDKLTARNKQYRLDNKDKLTARCKRYHLNNKDKLAVKRKQYNLNNKDYRKQYHNQRVKTDLLYKIKRKLRSVVGSAFKRISQNKPARTEQLLGCSWIEAKAHFERLFQEGMRWDNHGEWHIDHIRPVASFKEDELHLMNHISNLQPLWAEENLGPKKVADTVKWSLHT